ncbi:bifunctional RNase H/acid phosphatase [Streptomyces sp. NPDC005900]|uniref:bifunctional RNase H/acid phosphatase n=2 Tax=unclassified Streptomyces TaxID=2593676 RepID=UPI0033D0B45C
MREFIVEADGGSRGNPGPAGYGSVVIDAATGETLMEAAEYIGVATNNVAEYKGLVAGLKAAHRLDPAASVRVRMDSKLVVEQMSGRWKIKHPAMKPLAAEAARVFPPSQVTYEWIPRERNKHADRLANEAMDAGKRGERWSPSASTADLDAGAARSAATSGPADPPGDAAAGAAKARAALAEALAAGTSGPDASAPSASGMGGSQTWPAASGTADVRGGTSGAGGSGGSDGSDGTSVAGTTDVADATDVAGVADASDVPDAADATDVAGANGVAGAGGATDVAGVADASDVADAADATVVTDAAGASDVAGAADATDATDAADVTAAADASAATAVGGAERGDRRAAGSVARTPSVGWGASADLGAPATFVLLRHGETALTPQKRFSGSGGSDPSLSDVGREQARRAAAAFAARGTIQAIVSSPLRRCRETAHAVAARLGLDVGVEEGLRETDFGAWEGLTFGEVRERHPEQLTAWLASPEAAPPGGESFAAVAHRVAAARDRLTKAYAGRTVLLVTHVTPIKTLVRLALGAPPESLFRMELAAASVSAVAYYADGNASLRLLNDTSHLR